MQEKPPAEDGQTESLVAGSGSYELLKKRLAAQGDAFVELLGRPFVRRPVAAPVHQRQGDASRQSDTRVEKRRPRSALARG